MTLSTGRRQITIAYAERELGLLMGNHGSGDWLPEGERFVTATGIYDNFTVADGQDVHAWVTKPRKRILRAGLALLRACERERINLQERNAEWERKIERLVQFLRRSRANNVRIRHHYAWN